jgi:hypothetical protein
VVVVAGALALAGCQNAADEGPATAQAVPAETTATPAEAPPAIGYPPLQSVPPRPQLSYTVQQQRQIVEALVADRENARYTSQVIRYRSGLSSLPPPPTAPEKGVAGLPVIAAEEPAAAAPSLTDQETLIDFLATLRGEIFTDDPEPAAAPPPGGPEVLAPSGPEPAAPAPAHQPDSQELPAAQAIAPGEQQLDPPMPPARSSVAARMATRPQVVDELLDESIAQAPLPPGQTAVVAPPEAPRQLDAVPTAPLPAPRPAVTLTAGVALPSARPLVPPPPPTKPVVPVRSSDTWEPAPDRPAADSRANIRTSIIVANAAP